MYMMKYWYTKLNSVITVLVAIVTVTMVLSAVL